MASLRIPITVVSGFLGSGKTTLINQMIRDSAFKEQEMVVIENEIGEVGLDHRLLLKTDENILQLNNGCICCSLRTDLAKVFQTLLNVFVKQERPLKSVIIETTGVADPQPILQTLLTVPKITEYFYVDSLITIVDSENAEMCIERFDETKKQIILADRIILSKTEKVEVEQRASLQTRLQQLNPLADIKEFDLSTPLHAADFFGLDLFERVNFKAEEPIAEEDDHHHHAHHHHHGHGDYQAIHLASDQLLDEPTFKMWLDWANMTYFGSLYRFKGILKIAGYETLVELQGVNHQSHFNLTDQISEGTQSQLILIGKNLDVTTINQSFDDLIEMSRQKLEEKRTIK